MTSPMEDCKIKDVYVDQEGRLWRIIDRIDKPTCVLSAIDLPNGHLVMPIRDVIDSSSWKKFKRVYRPE